MDIYKYVNRGASTLSIGSYTILPFTEVISTTPILELDKVEGVLVDKYLNLVPVTNRVEFNSDSPVVSSGQDGGIRLDTSDPKYGWHDITSPTTIYAGASANKPSFDTFRGNIRQYSFIVNDESFHHFHIPHDYKSGSDLYIHAHWTHGAGGVSGGSVTWEFEASYAKGYAQGTWSTPVVVTATQAAPLVPYTHMIAEVPLSSVGGVGGLLDSNLIETDGLLEVRLRLLSNTTTGTPRLFMNFCDVHYQSTGIPTKNRNYNFWT